ncbi:hypothetical protein Tco_0323999 [Tanacetum coccineum]
MKYAALEDEGKGKDVNVSKGKDIKANVMNTNNEKAKDEGKGKDVNVSKGKDIKANVMNTNNEKSSGGKIEKKDNRKVHQVGSTSVENSNRKGMLGSNRFNLLDSLVNEEELVPNTDQRKIVDEFLIQKTKALKRKLKQRGWKNRNVFERAEELRKKVKESQKEVDMFPHDERVKEKSCMILKEYHEAIQDENNLLCQKAKVKWLKEGDRNVTYFHKTIKEMVHRGRIMTIRNEEGVRFEKEDVPVQIVKHFEEFLGKSNLVQKLSCISDIFLNKLNSEDALKMVRPISDSEIKNAMFEIKDSKAPGPDGYTSRFHKSAWSIVGKEVC